MFFFCRLVEGRKSRAFNCTATGGDVFKRVKYAQFNMDVIVSVNDDAYILGSNRWTNVGIRVEHELFLLKLLFYVS